MQQTLTAKHVEDAQKRCSTTGQVQARDYYYKDGHET